MESITIIKHVCTLFESPHINTLITKENVQMCSLFFISFFLLHNFFLKNVSLKFSLSKWTLQICLLTLSDVQMLEYKHHICFQNWFFKLIIYLPFSKMHYLTKHNYWQKKVFKHVHTNLSFSKMYLLMCHIFFRKNLQTRSLTDLFH